MNVIFLSSVPSNNKRGNSVYVESLTKEIKKKFKIFLIQPSFYTNKENKKGNLRIINIKVKKKFSQKDKFFYKKVEEVIFKLKLKHNIQYEHILYGHYFKRYVKNLGPNLAWTCHNVPPNEYYLKGFKDNFIIKSLIFIFHIFIIIKSKYSLIIVNSERVKRIFSPFKLLLPKIQIIGCGHNFKKKSYNRKSRKKNRILTIASFKPHKKLERVIEIAKILKIKKIDFQWDILSDKYNHDYQKKIMNLKKKFNIDEIKFHKSLSEKKKNNLYKKSDIYVQTSSEEGFCIPFLEASCHGNLHVLGSHAGAMPELANIFNCTICDSANEFAEEILKIIVNKKKLRNISNRNFINWSWKIIAKKTTQAYKII